MESARFDALTRGLAGVLTRRTAAGLLGLGALALPSLGDAKKNKKKRKKNKKRVKRNQFGCVNVGGFCKNGGQCCSGICQGKKDKKTCKAHDRSSCQAGQDVCLMVEVPCTTTAGAPGLCGTTTGNASYCFFTGECFSCSKDVDCAPLFGAGAACIVCEAGCPVTSTACVGLGEI